MPDLNSYNRTTINWDEIEALALRTAQETSIKPAPGLGFLRDGRYVDVCGPHWVLDHKWENAEEYRNSIREDSWWNSFIVLTREGKLKSAFITKVEISETLTNGDIHFLGTKWDHGMDALREREDDACDLDFDRAWRENGTHGIGNKIWGQSNRGQLLFPTRGEGLKRMLENIRTDRAHTRSDLTLPGSVTAETRVQQLPSLSQYHHSADERAAMIRQAETKRDERQRATDEREVSRRAAPRRQHDSVVLTLGAAAAVTVLAPYLFGHFLLRKTFLLSPDPDVYDGQARGLLDHFLPDYLAGVLMIALTVAAFLLLRPWEQRTRSVVIGWILIAASLIWLLPTTVSSWHHTEATAINHLRETPYPFASQYIECADYKFDSHDESQAAELWQIHLGITQGTQTPNNSCNRVNVYRGWKYVGGYNLGDGDTFTTDITVNMPNWSHPYTTKANATISQTNRVRMDPNAVEVSLLTSAGRTLNFALGKAGDTNTYDLR